MYVYRRVAPVAYLLRLFRHPKTDTISAIVFSGSFVGTAVLSSNGDVHFHSDNLYRIHRKYNIRSSMRRDPYFIQYKDPDNLTAEDLTLVVCGKEKYDLFNRLLNHDEQVRMINAIRYAMDDQDEYYARDNENKEE